MSRESDPDVDALHRIARALNLPVAAFFESQGRARFTPEQRYRLRVSMEELVMLMPTISRSEMLDRMMALVTDLSKTDSGAPNRGDRDEGISD